MLNLDGFPVTRKFSFVTRSARFRTRAMEVFLEILRGDQALAGLKTEG